MHRLLRALAIAGLFVVLPPISALHAEPPGEVVEAALRELAAAKRTALLELNVVLPNGSTQPYYGALISANGLALVDLSSLVHKKPPVILTAEGNPLKLVKILGMFTAEELALVQVDHRPKTWIEPRTTEVGIGESLVVLLPGEDVLMEEGKDVPPLIGPVVTRRVGMVSPNIRGGGFRRILSLGGVLSQAQAGRTAPGVFAIDGKGRIAGVWGGTAPVIDKAGRVVQTHLILTSMADVAVRLPTLAKGGKALPRERAGEYINTDLLGDVNRKFHLAKFRSDIHEAKQHLRTLLGQNPDDLSLRKEAVMMDLRDPDGNPMFSMEDFEADLSDPLAERIENLQIQAMFPMHARDLESAEAIIRKIIEIAPEGYQDSAHGPLAGILLKRGRPAEAAVILEKIYDSFSDNIPLTGRMEVLMISLGREKRAAEFSDRGWELEDIYRRR